MLLLSNHNIYSTKNEIYKPLIKALLKQSRKGFSYYKWLLNLVTVYGIITVIHSGRCKGVDIAIQQATAAVGWSCCWWSGGGCWGSRRRCWGSRRRMAHSNPLSSYLYMYACKNWNLCILLHLMQCVCKGKTCLSLMEYCNSFNNFV